MSSLNIRFGKIYVIMQPFIPTKTLKKMKNLGVSESEVLDVFSHGEFGETSGGALYASKKYFGYEIGLFYTRHPRTGEYIITHVWRRERR